MEFLLVEILQWMEFQRLERRGGKIGGFFFILKNIFTSLERKVCDQLIYIANLKNIYFYSNGRMELGNSFKKISSYHKVWLEEI